MTLLVFCALFFPVMLGGLSVFAFKTSSRFLKLLTAFSGAYLLAICFLEIIPEIYTGQNTMTIGLFILGGFFIQLFLDFLSKGVEHGHEHEHRDCEGHENHNISAIAVMIGICIHSFLEGMPLADAFDAENMRNTLLTGIVIHNIPISIVLVSLLLQAGKQKRTAFILLLVFALSSPLGTLTSHLIGKELIGNIDFFFSITMAMVVGIFLHISTTILFETDDQHHFNFYKLLSIILGAGVAILLAQNII
jgi:zinc transporter ZupT